MNKNRLLTLSGVALLTALAGCQSVGPDYTAPNFDLVGAYTPEIPVIAASQADHGRWWESTTDPVLQGLIEEGVANNIDLKIAISRIRAAAATARGVAGANGPTIDGSFDSSADRSTSSRASGDHVDDLGFGAGIDLSWTVDLWGGQTREEEVAEASYLRQVYLREDVYRTMISDIIGNYIELRGAQKRLALLQDSLDLQRQTSNIVQVRLQTGLGSELDLSRARAEVADLEATVPILQTTIDRSINAISILVGAQPGSHRDQLLDASPLPEFQSSPPIGIPADLLRRRPDVRAAELALIGATSQIGVETATLYPELTLNGSLALGATGYGSGPIVRTAMAAIGALLDATLYDGGERRANITVAEEEAEQAFQTYRQTLLAAIEEVESAIYGYVGAMQQRDSLIASVQYHRDAFEQSRVRYVQGLSDFLDVLDSQRSLTGSLQSLADAETDLELETINLYSAAGLSVEDVERYATQQGVELTTG
ncbi:MULTISPECIES: efflux transporter outer membrane subunit [Thalassospira]|uniref:Membrane protein n=2 Tax=Thalassospira TaxID=168934 RepID=A0A367W7N2_9PROT|nr:MULTISPECIES: TolC family protein [Thalassospira]MDG4720592.1 TolC family protein [Thalassospira sp. FZY0004]RCK37436.1 membrane protein [Thalassospira profundimaris]